MGINSFEAQNSQGICMASAEGDWEKEGCCQLV